LLQDAGVTEISASFEMLGAAVVSRCKKEIEK